MANKKQPANGATAEAGGGGLKSIFSAPRVAPHVVELSPAQGSPVVKRQIETNSDVYLEISVLSFHHPDARKGLTKQAPLIFAEASWRRSKDTDLPQLAVMGPNPEAHPNMKSQGHYAFGGRTFFGPAKFDGAVDFSLGMHLFKSNAAARTMIDVARVGSKMLPKGEMLILGQALDGGIDTALKGIKELLPDTQTPWLVGVIDSLPKVGTGAFETGTWAIIEGGGPAPGDLYLDRHSNLLRDAAGKPLQKPYVVYSVNATETSPDRLRIGGIAKAYDRLREAFKGGVGEAALKGRFQQFCAEVEFSDELTERDREEIIADAQKRFDRLMERHTAGEPAVDAALFPEKEVSSKAVSSSRAGKDAAEIETDTTQAIDASLKAFGDPDAAAQDEGFTALLGELHTAVEDYAALVRSNPDEHRKSVKDVAKKLRRQREFKALLDLATQVRNGGVEIGWLNYFGAFADIELNGVPDLPEKKSGGPAPEMLGEAYLAKAIELSGADYENDPDLLSDCLGLQGRIWKTRAIRPGLSAEARRQAFERSYAFYNDGIAVGTDPQFHQVNLLGLIAAADRLGVALGKKGEGVKWARDILKQMKKGGADTDWKLANAGDAALFLGREADALKHYEAYIEAAKDNPFAVNATRRQLVEIWGVNPKGNTPLSALVRKMMVLAMRSMATVSLTVEEIEAVMDADTGELQGLLDDGVKAIPAAHIRKVLNLSQCVGRVCRANGDTSGTGFLLHGRNLHPALANEYVFLTNDHVVCDVKDYGGISIRSEEATIRFDDLDKSGEYRVTEVFWRSDSTAHDCAILRLSKQPQGITAEFEVADTLPPRHVTETGRSLAESNFRAPRVFIIGHPDGRGLEITFEQNFLVDHELKSPTEKPTPKPVRIHYRAPTEKGNSGSPVLSAATQQLIGIHHRESKKPLREIPRGEQYKANEGLWIQAIIAAVRAERADAPAAPANGSGGLAEPAPAPEPAPSPELQAKPAPAPQPAAPAPAPQPVAPAPQPVAQAPQPVPPPAPPAAVVQPAAPAAPAAPAVPAAPPEAPAHAGPALAGRIQMVAEADEAAFDNIEGATPEARSLESTGGVAARFGALSPKPEAKWAPHSDHPDTKHMAGVPVDLNNGMSFNLSGPVLRQALAIAATPIGPKWSRKVLFGIRGALPKATMSDNLQPDFSLQVAMRETEPNHRNYMCTMGVWDLDTDQVFVCHGSTVPAVGYLWNSTFGRSGDQIGKNSNMLSPGVYTHVVGTHANGTSTRQPGAFRQKSKMCVMRLAGPVLSFRQGNIRWDTASDANEVQIHDNIHAGLVASKSWGADHYSAGCQVVRGSVMTLDSRDIPAGHWRAFRMAAGLPPAPQVKVGSSPLDVATPADGTPYTYILLTAREVRIASENLTANPMDRRFFKLRRGSQGDVVKALQASLGIGADGDFGFLTQRALIEKQLATTGEADGVVTASNAAAFGLA